MKHLVTFYIDENNTIEHIIKAKSSKAVIIDLMNREDKRYVFESDDEVYYINLDHVKYIKGFRNR
ncbi:hypothetical protein [Bacillus sp. JCM 19041]|uniref:hypothetical protein n=1 Tax=Bacillus sp. JCM 19041 TaxID=1460637 RepID=UPI0006D06CFB